MTIPTCFSFIKIFTFSSVGQIKYCFIKLLFLCIWSSWLMKQRSNCNILSFSHLTQSAISRFFFAKTQFPIKTISCEIQYLTNKRWKARGNICQKHIGLNLAALLWSQCSILGPWWDIFSAFSSRFSCFILFYQPCRGSL